MPHRPHNRVNYTSTIFTLLSKSIDSLLWEHKLLMSEELWLRLRRERILRPHQAYGHPRDTFSSTEKREINEIFAKIGLPFIHRQLSGVLLKKISELPEIPYSDEDHEKVMARANEPDDTDDGDELIPLPCNEEQRTPVEVVELEKPVATPAPALDTLAQARAGWKVELGLITERIAALEEAQQTLEEAKNRYREAESALTAQLKYDPTEQNARTAVIAATYVASINQLMLNEEAMRSWWEAAITKVKALLPTGNPPYGQNEDLGLANRIAASKKRAEALSEAIALSLERERNRSA